MPIRWLPIVLLLDVHTLEAEGFAYSSYGSFVSIHTAFYNLFPQTLDILFLAVFSLLFFLIDSFIVLSELPCL